MPALEQAVLHVRGMAGQGNGGLGDVIARLGLDAVPEFLMVMVCAAGLEPCGVEKLSVGGVTALVVVLIRL